MTAIVPFIKAGTLAAVCLLLTFAVPKPVVSLQNSEKAELTDTELTKAKSLFKEKCARCHGEDGRGQTVLGQMLNPPNFTEEKWGKADFVSDDDLAEIVGHGKSEMPAFGKKLTRQEIAHLIMYIRLFSKNKS